jgi:hypothetical protein
LKKAGLKCLVAEHLKCPECGKEVTLEFSTVTIATSCSLSCSSNEGSFVAHGSNPASAKLSQFEEDGYVRNTDFAINCLYVLAHIASGGGAKEAGRLLGLLGLPNCTTMSGSNFARIEDRIALHQRRPISPC